MKKSTQVYKSDGPANEFCPSIGRARSKISSTKLQSDLGFAQKNLVPLCNVSHRSNLLERKGAFLGIKMMNNILNVVGHYHEFLSRRSRL